MPATLQRLNRPVKIISNGNSIEFNLTWRDMDGLLATPTQVRYQVFDSLSGSSVSPLVAVINPAPQMIVRVPGNHLPAGSSAERNLTVQIQGEFGSATDVHTEFIEVQVRKIFSFI